MSPDAALAACREGAVDQRGSIDRLEQRGPDGRRRERVLAGAEVHQDRRQGRARVAQDPAAAGRRREVARRRRAAARTRRRGRPADTPPTRAAASSKNWNSMPGQIRDRARRGDRSDAGVARESDVADGARHCRRFGLGAPRRPDGAPRRLSVRLTSANGPEPIGWRSEGVRRPAGRPARRPGCGPARSAGWPPGGTRRAASTA